MKNRNRWFCHFALISIVFLTTSQAYTASPFDKYGRDFVAIPELSNIELQTNELTYGQWNILNAQLPAAHQNPWESLNSNEQVYLEGRTGPNYPAAGLSFEDVQAYIHILNSQDSEYTYRLPTTTELGYLIDLSVRALSFKGDILDHLLSRHGWYSIDGNHAHEVCTKEPLFGFCDVLGNVWELTSTLSGSEIVLRGDSWGNSIASDSPGGETTLKVSTRSPYAGFRLVRIAK